MDILFGRDPLQTLAAFFVCGVLLGVVYDLLAVRRLFSFGGAVRLFFDDLLFTLFSGAVMLSAAYAFGNGNWRWYELPAALTGILLYRLTVSRVLLAVCRKAARLFKSVLRFVLSPIGRFAAALRVCGARLKEGVYRGRLMRRIAVLPCGGPGKEEKV